MAKKYVEDEKIRASMICYGFRAPDMTVTEFVEDLLPAADVEEVDRYEQGRIEGRVQMRTELLTALKRIVGDEVWRNI